MRKIYYTVSLIVLVIGLLGIRRLYDKPDLPFKYDSDLACESDSGNISRGDAIQSVDGIPVTSESQLEFILDGRKIGDSVALNFLYAGDSEKNVSVRLVYYYSGRSFIIISLILGLAFWLSAVFVISKKPDDKAAKILIWIFLVFGLAILTPSPPYSGKSDVIGYIVRIAHVWSYMLGVSLFVHFTCIFPQNKLNKKAVALSIIYLPSIILCALLAVSISEAIGNFSLYWLNMYRISFKIVEILLLTGISCGTINLYLSYRKLTLQADRRKIEWIYWGITAGVMPFLLFWVVPDVLTMTPPFHEEFVLIFLILVPVSFAIAVLKYRIFDIELIIKRSVLYFVLSALIVMIYFGLLYGVTFVSHGYLGENDRIVSVIITFLIALLFNPLRIRVKKAVDRIFYRVKYDLNKAVAGFTNRLKQAGTLSQLGSAVVSEIGEHIPVSKIAIAVSNGSDERLKMLSQNNFDRMSHNIAALRLNKIETGYNHPFVLPEAVEQGIEINTSLDAALRRWEICAAVPLVIESKEIVGVLILGKKLSGLRYSPSDMELLNILTSQIAVAVRRLQLQEKLVLEEIENTRLEELNMLKSYFVSSVSHDLKTPLTSIKMFAEMLGSAKKLSAKKKKDYTHIIEGESDRLTRLIDNVLEFSKIEKGISDYDFLEVDLNELVKDVLNSLQYQFEMQNFEVKIKYSPEKNLITADRDAVTGSMINILSNAVKFSNRKKRVEVAVFQKNGFAGFKVRDEGIGISEAGLSSIFEPFYRSNEEHSERIKGTGLGLSIVKHVMDAHHGKIEVKSKPGKGSTFTLLFPIK